MWYYLLLPTFFWSLSLQSEILDLMAITDRYFKEFQVAENPNFVAEAVKSMLRRNYNLNEDVVDGHEVHKRSIFDDNVLVRDKRGVYVVSDIKDVITIPTKFPSDINIISSHNLLYITSLESNGSNPEIELANFLVVYQYSFIQGINEMGRVPVSGGTRIAMYSYQNVTYLISAEHDVTNVTESFLGSTLYKMVEWNGKIYLEKLQILNVIQPNDVRLWEHQDQLFLSIDTNMNNDTQGTGVLIYRWSGFHFDCLQTIQSKNVKSATPFAIGSFMYLAIANYMDELGNSDIESEIFKFYLDDMKFRPFQKIRTHGARSFSYFNFDDTHTRESEHFLAVANSADDYVTESIIYKYDSHIFVPFQSFKLPGATQWLPIKGSDGQFLLLAAYSSGVVGYQYDGWRFTQISLHFHQSSFGESISSMRSFQYFGETFLTIADKNSHGNTNNLWKISFSKKNDLEKQYQEVGIWCDVMSSKLAQDNFSEVLKNFEPLLDEKLNRSRLDVTVDNLKEEDFDEEIRDELVRLSEEAKKLEEALKKAEENLVNLNVGDLPIFIGSKEIPYLEMNCSTQDCCSFKNVEILKVNGENFPEFLANVVSLGEDLKDSALNFEHLVVKEEVSPLRVNGKPSQTLIDVSSDTFINADLVLNGTVFINGDLNVNGMFDGIHVSDDHHLLLSRDFQNFEDKLKVDSLKVKNLKFSGLLNGIPIDTLMNEPEMNLENSYKELNVNNIVVEGFVNDNNMSEVFGGALRKSGNQQIEGNFYLVSLEAEEIIIESNKISNVTISEYLRLIKERVCESEPDLFPKEANSELEYSKLRTKRNEMGGESNGLTEFSDEYVIIVEGLLKATDISDESSSTSILEIMANSFSLNTSVIDSTFIFSDVIANEFVVEDINDVSLSSWILKNSTLAQHVYGKKTFADGIHIEKRVSVENINEINLNELEKDVLTLNGDQIVRSEVKFKTIECYEIKTNFLNVGEKPFVKVNRLEIQGPLTLNEFRTKNLTVKNGVLNNVSWTNVVEDSIFSENDVILGQKTLQGRIRIEDIEVTERINGFSLNEFVAMNSKEPNKIVIDGGVKLSGSLTTDKLDFEGLIDEILKPNFEHEWLLQDEAQIITVPVTFSNLDMKMGSSLMNETINNTNLRKLFKRSAKINEDVKIKHLYLVGDVKARRIDIAGNLNGANFNDSIVWSKSKRSQELSGQWFFTHGLKVNGSFVVEGHVSGLNLSHVCSLNLSDKISLIVGGSVSLAHEPKIKSTVNGIDFSKKSKEFWMKSENVTLKGRALRFENVGFENKTILSGHLNNVNLSEVSRYYLSKTLNRIISSDFEFEHLVIRKGCRMHGATIEGMVNGINITHLANNVLLQDKDQVIEEKLRFEIFQTSDVTVEGKVNELNLSSDVLRLDMSDVVVEGEKTFQGASVANLMLAPGKTLQGVNVDAWKENLIKNTGDIVLQGNLILNDAEFNSPFTVVGRVSDIDFDSANLLTTKGNKVVTGTKRFELDAYPKKKLKMRSLELAGFIGDLDLEDLIKNQAYSDRDLKFTQPQTFLKGLVARSIALDGFFQKVNVSELCVDVFNPVNVNNREKEYKDLLKQTKTLIGIAENSAFFFDYFELIQTLKPNVKAVVPSLGTEGNYLLAVFTSQVMTFMEWNTYSGGFTNIDEGLRLKDNVTFVTSEITENGALLYIENTRSTNIFQSNSVVELEMRDTSCVASFVLKPLNRTCIFVGQKRNSSRILCESSIMNNLQTFQWLEMKGSVQVTTMEIEDEIYIAVINKEEIFDKTENTLTIYRFDPNLQHFYLTHTLAEVNPVALSSISYKNDLYLVSAGGHLPESVHNSVLSIFRFNKRHKVFVRAQSIQVDTPVDVHFALLPSSQLALYVLTSNPTKPFVMFLHKGISGLMEETSGLSLYPGSKLYSFTDSEKQHFVLISGYGRGQILKAGFKGGNTTK